MTAADLRGADLRGSILEGARFGNVSLNSTDIALRSARQAPTLDVCDLSGVDRRGANLQEMNLVQVRLTGATLRNAALFGANLTSAQLQGADLSGAKLKQAILTTADLRHANLQGSDFSGANLIGASLAGANLKGAQLEGAVVGWTDFTGTGFGFVRSFSSVVHLGPSTTDVDTLLTSFRQATESSESTLRAGTTAMTSFMRGIGVPEEILNFTRNRSTSVAQTSCFISYSTLDIAFVKQLHSDLQDEGIRCWYAPESLRVGEEIKGRIEEAIQKHAKLVVILSENSMKSEWVEFEVVTAIREERQNPSLKLVLPIRIDASVDTTAPNWVKRIRGSRVIGDFRHWADPQHYRQSLRSLIEAILMAEQ